MPGLMKPIEYNNRVLVDGDLQKGSPMWRLSKNLQPKNERILEFRLEGDFEGNDKNTIEYINSLYTYATAIATEFIMEVYNKNDKYDYIVINTGDVNIVDFNLPTDKRENLMQIGYSQTMNYFKDVLPLKKENLLKIYTEIETHLKKVKSNIESNNIKKAKETLTELFMYLCDYVNVIDIKDFNELKEFKDILFSNIVYPALFGKTGIKNEKLVLCKLEQVTNNIADKTSEYKQFLKL